MGDSKKEDKVEEEAAKDQHEADVERQQEEHPEWYSDPDAKSSDVAEASSKSVRDKSVGKEDNG